MKISDAVNTGANVFAAAGIEDPLVDARVLMTAATGLSTAEILAHPERELSEAEEGRFLEFMTRRANREPAAYITGTTEFMGLEFIVSEKTLVPRPDTETLVEEVMFHLHDGMRFLDLCTGTGCIAISLLRYSNDTHAVATDISADALAVATENAKKLGVSERIRLVEADLYLSLNKAAELNSDVPRSDSDKMILGSGERFDVIVSNPPYIPAGDIPGLMPEVSKYEPSLALDGGADGLDFYRRIAKGAGDFLYSGGWLLCETGYDQAAAVVSIYEAAGFKDISVAKDLGGMDRVVKGCLY